MVALSVLSALSTIVVVQAPAHAAAGPPRDITGFACPPGLSSPFADVASSVHAAAIDCAYAYGVTNGTTATSFSPREVVTRGQMASFIARALAFSGVTVEPGETAFADIEGSPHAPAIAVLVAFGVVQGTTPTTFAPNVPVTRAQAATLLGRAIELGAALPSDPDDAFPDDEQATAHEGYINSLAAVGVIGGITADRFAPRAAVTRGAMASMVARTIDFMIEAGAAQPLEHVGGLGAALTGDAEVPGPGDPAAQVTVRLDRFTMPGMLCVTWDIDGPLADDATAAHVHTGAAGVAGPVLFPLATPQTTAGERGWERGCANGIDDDLIDDVFENPAGFYVNIHTAAFPDGAVRGQLSPLATLLGTALTGAEEVPAGEEGAGGEAFVDILEDGTTVCAFISYLGAEVPMAAHIHEGVAGANGPIVVTLPPFDVEGPVADGCVGGVDPALVADLAANPEDYYVNVHTDHHPDGAVRGQLAESVQLQATLTGAAEAPGPGDPDGDGRAFFDLVGDGLVCVQLEVRGIDAPVAAHIHEAGPGVAGPIAVPLPTPIFNTVRTCFEAPPGLSEELAANPADFYVNVHTATFPDGALRGQLAVDPV